MRKAADGGTNRTDIRHRAPFGRSNHGDRRCRAQPETPGNCAGSMAPLVQMLGHRAARLDRGVCKSRSATFERLYDHHAATYVLRHSFNLDGIHRGAVRGGRIPVAGTFMVFYRTGIRPRAHPRVGLEFGASITGMLSASRRSNGDNNGDCPRSGFVGALAARAAQAGRVVPDGLDLLSPANGRWRRNLARFLITGMVAIAAALIAEYIRPQWSVRPFVVLVALLLATDAPRWTFLREAAFTWRICHCMASSEARFAIQCCCWLFPACCDDCAHSPKESI